MKKIIVSLVALSAIVPAFADGDCGCKSKNCKPKKVRVVYVGAPSDDAATYESTVLSSEPQYETQEITVSEATKLYEPVVEPAPRVRKSSRSDSDWYLGGRIGVDLLSWKNKYTATPAAAIADPDFDHDNYVFEPVFGGDLFVGYHFSPAMRGDVELGYMTQFEDSDNGVSFKMSTFYTTFNAYYDFTNHFYLGAGLGFAFPKINVDFEYFAPGSNSETKLSLMWAAMAGYTYDLSDRVMFDFRYRLSGFWGPEMTRGGSGFNVTGTPLNALTTKVGFVLDNQFSVGLRYEF